MKLMDVNWGLIKNKPNFEADYAGRDAYQKTVTVADGGEWVTVAELSRGRGSAMFKLMDGQSSYHSHTTFYASVVYGGDEHINVVSSSSYGEGCVDKLRIVADVSDRNGEVYGAYKIQAFLDRSTYLTMLLFLDEYPHNAWYLTNMSELGTPTGYTTVTELDLNSVHAGIATTGELYAQGNSKAFHTKNPPSHEQIINRPDETLLIEENGYCQLANGLLMQWGVHNRSKTLSSVLFPKKFSAAPFSFQLTPRGKIPGLENVVISGWDGLITTSGFSFVSQRIDEIPEIHWQAIGRL